MGRGVAWVVELTWFRSQAPNLSVLLIPKDYGHNITLTSALFMQEALYAVEYKSS